MAIFWVQIVKEMGSLKEVPKNWRSKWFLNGLIIWVKILQNVEQQMSLNQNLEKLW